MPTTPSCNSGIEHAERRRRSLARRRTALRRSASACSCMPPSMSRRSRLSASSCCASSSARAGVVGEQALDAERHVGEPAGGVEARARARSRGRRRSPRRGVAAGRPRTAPRRPACARRRGCAQSLRDEEAVVGVEPHHVGHGAERDQVEQRGEVRLVARVERAARAQLGAQREQHVEHHADAGDVLARETAAGLVRIDDARRRRQRAPGQVVVGHQHLDASALARRPRLRRWRCRCPR